MNKVRHYHLIGIGGIGMSGIAKLFLRHGIKISGSDLKESKITEELKKLGAEVFVGHHPKNITGADLIIYSSAIKEDNPEVIQARRYNIPLIKRAQALARLMKDKIVITISGSHGKTTTTSLISYLLLEAGLFPTVAIGGILRNIDNHVSFGDGEFFVAEADESDGSFLYYRPKYSIITNIDYEHIDYYKDFKNIINTFKEFLSKTQKDGCLFCCNDDINLRNILQDYKNRYVLFGINEDADIYPRNIRIEGLSSQFDCFYKPHTFGKMGGKDRFIDRFHLALGGRHNISNALAVIALGLELNIDLGFIKRTLSKYKGAHRRLEIKFEDKKYRVIDDYAHHPTEIKATLATIKNLKSNRIIVIFQPHRFTRTKLLLNEFGKSFDLADYIIITDIYPASEILIEGIDGKVLFDKIKGHNPNKKLVFLPKREIIGHIIKIIEPGDLIITLGAGDIGKVCDELVERIKGQS